MKKNLLQDIVPSSKKSIRDIAVPVRRSKKETPVVEKPVERENISRPALDYSEPIAREERPASDYRYDFEPPKKSSKKILYTTMVVFILALAFGISALFKSVKITIEPKKQTVQLNSNFTANKNSQSGLAFQIVTVSKDVQKTVASDGQVQVQKKAVGTVVIFNTTALSQKLVAGTRLQTPEGLIFHLNSAVTVPAQKTVSGGKVPGSAEVVVTADTAGDKYNVGLKDFTIPGFKGTTKYSQIYGRSKTTMAGGFSGTQAVISKQVLASTTAELQNNLKTSLASDVTAQIPANFILYPDSMTFSFSPMSQAGTNGNGTVVDEKGTAYGVIFDRGDLARSIAEIYSIVDTTKIDNLDSLNFKYATGTAFNPAGDSATLNFSLTGSAHIVWTFDANKLETQLLGLSKNQAKEVMSGYPAISQVWVETSPFWNQTIPTDPKKVRIDLAKNGLEK